MEHIATVQSRQNRLPTSLELAGLGDPQMPPNSSVALAASPLLQLPHLPRSLFLSLPMFSDDTQIDATNLPARLRNALARAGIRTAGEVRNLSDVDLLSLSGVGRSALRMLRKLLGPSLAGRWKK